LFFKCTFVNYRHSLTKFLRMIDRVFFVETKQSQPAMLAHNGLQLLQIINEAESIFSSDSCLPSVFISKTFYFILSKHSDIILLNKCLVCLLLFLNCFIIFNTCFFWCAKFSIFFFKCNI
jgi:hypothetical protein